jgi:hypothetical protein
MLRHRERAQLVLERERVTLSRAVQAEYFALVGARLAAGRFLTDVDNAPAGAGTPVGSAEDNGRWFESLARFDHRWKTPVVSRI